MRTTIGTTDYLHILTFNISPLKIDWKILAEDIKATGMSLPNQAHAVGKEWSTFQAWLSGCQPRFMEGHAMLILHAQRCGVEWTEYRMKEFLESGNAEP